MKFRKVKLMNFGKRIKIRAEVRKQIRSSGSNPRGSRTGRLSAIPGD
jgi:hypothetical protein